MDKAPPKRTAIVTIIFGYKVAPAMSLFRRFSLFSQSPNRFRQLATGFPPPDHVAIQGVEHRGKLRQGFGHRRTILNRGAHPGNDGLQALVVVLFLERIERADDGNAGTQHGAELA